MRLGFTRRGRIVGGVTVLALLAVGATAAHAAAGGGGVRYRLATATLADVEQTVSSVGTVSSVNRAAVAFPVAGTVGSVLVTVGDRVTAGQVLASLSTTSLDQQLATANAQLATARQTLASDQASQTGTGQTGAGSLTTDSAGAVRIATRAVLSASRSTAPGSGTASGTGSGSGGGSVGQLVGRVDAAQQALLAAQRRLDADLTAAEQALSSCRTTLSQASPSPTGTSSPTGTPTLSSSPSGSAAPTSSAAPGSAAPGSAGSGSAASGGGSSADQCLAAIGQAPDQAEVAADRQARDRAERELDAAVSQLGKAASGANRAGVGSSGGSPGGSRSSNAGRSSTGTGGGSAGTGRSAGNGGSAGLGGRASSGPASAAQLAADQARIDADQAAVAVANQNLAAAVLTTPLAGTVAAVSITAGSSVPAGSSTATITVLAAGAEQVSTSVGLADLDSVRVGEPVTVRVDGLGTALTGRVSLVGLLNSGSGSSTSYPVTVALNATTARLYDGSGATVTIAVKTAQHVLTVPTSAVHTLGSLHTVQVLRSGKATITRVTLGAVGADRTQITSGLTAGAQVILADLSQPLPSTG